jgi:hypothetical protein
VGKRQAFPVYNNKYSKKLLFKRVPRTSRKYMRNVKEVSALERLHIVNLSRKYKRRNNFKCLVEIPFIQGIHLYLF